METRLVVKNEQGSDIEIDVIDIVESNEFNKEYIIYAVVGDENNIYASILEEGDTTFSLNTITTQEELEFINTVIAELTA